MKFTVLGFITALVASVSAQVINNVSSIAPVAAATTVAIVVPTPSAVSACAVQST